MGLEYEEIESTYTSKTKQELEKEIADLEKEVEKAYKEAFPPHDCPIGKPHRDEEDVICDVCDDITNDVKNWVEGNDYLIIAKRVLEAGKYKK